MGLFRLILIGLLLLATPATAERKVAQALNDSDISFDPVYSSDANGPVIADSLFDTLLSWDADGQLLPALAESWDVSADNLVYTFHLADNRRWTDGEPVVAEDFVTAFRRFVDPATDDRIVLRYLLDSVVNATMIGKGEMAPEKLGVRAIDSRTLEITLAGPASYFPEILAQPALSAVPTHMIKKHGGDWAKAENLVTDGPYTIENFEPGRLLLTRNKDFHMQPAPDKLELLFVKATEDLMRLLASNKVDVVLTLPQKEVAVLQSGDWVKDVAVETSPATTYVALNNTRPPFNDLRVRQAVNLAIDREVLNAAQSQFAGLVATTFTSPSLFVYGDGSEPPALPSYDERLKQARALLAEAGYTDETPIKLTMIRREASPQSQPSFVGIRSMLGQLPIQVEIAELSRKDLLDRLTAKNFDAAVLTWQADYSDPMTFLALFRAGGFANFAGWENPAYQKLLDQALVEPGRKDRERIYWQMEDMIREDVPIIPLRHSSISIVWSKNLKLPKLVNGILYPRLIQFLDE